MGLIDNLLSLTLHRVEPVRTAPRPSVPQQLCRDPRVNKRLKTGGYCAVLNNAMENRYDAVAAAGELLEQDMVFVPAGVLRLDDFGIGSQSSFITWEESFFIDRHLVTNSQYKHFLNEDGYRNEVFWPKQVWPLVSRMFIDTTGVPAPASWVSANFDPAKADHPVVGISWFEATAYANWIGKTLPTTTQWQRAGTWWRPGSRFPWGERNDRRRMNTYGSGHGDTVSVYDYEASSTPLGIQQLAGNVWEWTGNFHTELSIDGAKETLEEPIGEIRGGAFDTYLAAQSTCSYRGAQPLLNRSCNVGFRCVASHELLAVITNESS